MTEQTKTADRILWLDLETDGLDTDRCQVLEVGCVLTKGFADGLEVVSEFTSPVWPLFGEAALEAMPAAVQAMHRASGLWADCLADADLTPDQVEAEWLRWLNRHDLSVGHRGSVVVGGSGVDRFDIPIIERVWPVVAGLFHWRRMDVSAMKLLLNETGHVDLAPKHPGQAHRALDDARWARDAALVMADLVDYAAASMGTVTLDVTPQIDSWGWFHRSMALDALTVSEPPYWATWSPPLRSRLEETLSESGNEMGWWVTTLEQQESERAEATTPADRDDAHGFLDRWRACVRRTLGGQPRPTDDPLEDNA